MVVLEVVSVFAGRHYSLFDRTIGNRLDCWYSALHSCIVVRMRRPRQNACIRRCSRWLAEYDVRYSVSGRCAVILHGYSGTISRKNVSGNKETPDLHRAGNE